MMHSENEQILGMVRFMRGAGMHAALQQRDWTAFARRYNGPAFAQNRYHEKLAEAHSRLSSGGLPDLDVRAVQLLLTYHGFNPGKIDGVAGARTRAAITAFAAKHQLPATPENHEDLHAALRDRLAPVPDDRAALSSSTPAPSPSVPDLRLVQSLLAFLGRDPGPVDGKPGPRTRTAVMEFQRSLGVVPTGEADARLLSALKADAMRAFGHNQIADVRLVQRILVAKGFDTGGIDGLVGPRTKAAITAFQRAQQGAPSAGAIDATFLGALLAER